MLTDDELRDLMEDETPAERVTRSRQVEDHRVAEVGERINDGRKYPVRTFTVDQPPAWLVGRV